MDSANGSDAAATPIETPVRRANGGGIQAALALATAQTQRTGTAPLGPGEPHRPAMIAPYNVHGSVLEGGDSPAVLAQPAAVTSEGQGSALRPSRVVRHARRSLGRAQQAVSSRYRVVKEGSDDYVHDNPWKSISRSRWRRSADC
ncbi:hypothetical protein BRCH_02037c [Candidatus Burkholderia brachyanthoides]|nr:hypothetical protein BRCH_02037c [Candidatus Burkholderia brachyanthoides]